MRNRYPRLFGTCLLALMAFVFAAGCKKKPAPPPPPPPAPTPQAAPAKPTATLSVNPTSIERGQSATLEWSTSNATSVTIDTLGAVAASGSQSVRPTQSTTYRLTATGAGGTETATARVTVTNPPPPPPPVVQQTRGPTEEELFAQEVKTIYFDYDKYEVRDDQKGALQGNANFLRAHPSLKVVIEGHCDERGSEEYNLGLGDRRANSLKEALGAMGIGGDRIRTLSYGKERPVCTDSNEDCWQKNRRGQFVLDR
jgi:peptidoglycan-associated lipoprotein